jgi:hypothetical protein
VKFLADARLNQKEEFNLRAFHDFLWKNGNAPIALLRWEYLGLSDEIELLDASEPAGQEVSTGSGSDPG